MLFLGAFIAWTILQDIRDAPARRKQEAEIKKAANAPVSVQDLRDTCESPAELAFLNAMINAYELKSGNGGLEGNGLRLESQKGLGKIRTSRSRSWYEYRADFVIDERLIVEIDGAAFHSSPEAILRDRKRDSDLAREGYHTLRLRAKDVFRAPLEAIATVEDARLALQNGNRLSELNKIEAELDHAEPETKTENTHHNSRLTKFLGEVERRSKIAHAEIALEKAIDTLLSDIENLVCGAMAAAAAQAPPDKFSADERRKTSAFWLKEMAQALQQELNDTSKKKAECLAAFDAIAQTDERYLFEWRIGQRIDAHLSAIKAAHTSIFPEIEAFPDVIVTGMSQRETLAKELRMIFFEGANPLELYHPYVPPASGGVIFTSWWRRMVTGRDPLSRSLSKLAVLSRAAEDPERERLDPKSERTSGAQPDTTLSADQNNVE